MSKKETIANLISVREQIIALAQSVPPEKRDEIFLGVWSCKDLLAHLVGWDFTNTDSVKEIRQGKVPTVFKHWNPDWQAFNAQLVKQYKRADWNEMLAAIRASHRALIEFLEKIPTEDFEKDFGVRSPRGRNITIAYHLQAEIDDEQTHYQQMMDWLRR
jgi:hypothetical protein